MGMSATNVLAVDYLDWETIGGQSMAVNCTFRLRNTSLEKRFLARKYHGRVVVPWPRNDHDVEQS
jgi:hypothetical protein